MISKTQSINLLTNIFHRETHSWKRINICHSHPSLERATDTPHVEQDHNLFSLSTYNLLLCIKCPRITNITKLGLNKNGFKHRPEKNFISVQLFLTIKSYEVKMIVVDIKVKMGAIIVIL